MVLDTASPDARMTCMNRQSSHGGSWADTSTPRYAHKSWLQAMLMYRPTVFVDEVHSLHVNILLLLEQVRR